MGIQRGRERKKVDDPRILNWAWGYLEADFHRFYDIDINHAVFRGGMTARKLMILVRGLPPDSAFAAFYKDKTNRDAASYRPESLMK